MEHTNIKVDAARFDEVVHGGLPMGRDLEFVVKDGATQEGLPVVAITFSVQLPDGTLARAQAVTTARMVVALGRFMEGHFAALSIPI